MWLLQSRGKGIIWEELGTGPHGAFRESGPLGPSSWSFEGALLSPVGWDAVECWSPEGWGGQHGGRGLMGQGLLAWQVHAHGALGSG